MICPRVSSSIFVLVAYLAGPSDTYIMVTCVLSYIPAVLGWISFDSVIQALNLNRAVLGLEVTVLAFLFCALMYLLFLGQYPSFI